MPNYLVTYHGGEGPPSTPEAQQQIHAAFGAWAASVGDAMVDSGAPLGATRSVSANGSEDGPTDGAIGGYTLLRAADLDAALNLVSKHPFISRGGTLQVSEAMTIGD
jgi:hypothetical protein